MPESMRRLRGSDVETLVVSPDLDINTPAQVATRELLPLLSHGHQVILKNQAHNDATWMQGRAFQRLVLTYLASGKVDDSKFVDRPMEFKPRWRLPTLAKLGSGGVLLLIILLLVICL